MRVYQCVLAGAIVVVSLLAEGASTDFAVRRQQLETYRKHYDRKKAIAESFLRSDGFKAVLTGSERDRTIAQAVLLAQLRHNKTMLAERITQEGAALQSEQQRPPEEKNYDYISLLDAQISFYRQIDKRIESCIRKTEEAFGHHERPASCWQRLIRVVEQFLLCQKHSEEGVEFTDTGYAHD